MALYDPDFSRCKSHHQMESPYCCSHRVDRRICASCSPCDHACTGIGGHHVPACRNFVRKCDVHEWCECWERLQHLRNQHEALWVRWTGLRAEMDYTDRAQVMRKGIGLVKDVDRVIRDIRVYEAGGFTREIGDLQTSLEDLKQQIGVRLFGLDAMKSVNDPWPEEANILCKQHTVKNCPTWR